MSPLAEVVEADRRWLLERIDQFVNVQCPVCDIPGTLAFTKKGFSYEACHECQTIFMNPRPPKVLLHRFYEQSQTYSYWNRHIFPATEPERRAKIFGPRATRVLEFCQQYKTQRRTILEIGAGFGTFCEEIRARDIFERVLALEMTPGLAASCRDRGLEVIESPVEGLLLHDETIDVIAAFETLEHLYSPREFITACHGLLSKDGLLVLTCPSIHGFDVVVLGESSDTIDHEHLNYLNVDSLARLAEKCGFEVLETLTPGRLDADIVRNKVMEGTFSLNSQPWLKHLLIDRWDSLGEAFQTFLVENKLSSHMWLVAIKRGA